MIPINKSPLHLSAIVFDKNEKKTSGFIQFECSEEFWVKYVVQI